MNIRFSDLAKILREDPDLMVKINSIQDLSCLNEKEIDQIISFNPNFQEHFNLFIKDYGHRSNTREIFYPRWREDKIYVLEVIKLLSSSNLDLRKNEEESRKIRFKTEKKVLKLINKQKYGYFKSKIFFKTLKLAQIYLTFRENQRFYLDHLLFRQRLILLQMGNCLYERKIINHRDDVF
ncbi:MAG: phosphoenolpyruvate protein kinase, partial [Methanobacterium sp.]|nr:phosphoenolpyruvate protein kinase [Methanobacterium sp.]